METTYRSSFSQHRTFDTCPKTWYWSSILKIPAPEGDMFSANAGDCMHKALDKYYQTKDIQLAKDLFDYKWNFYKLNDSRLKLQKDEYWGMVLNGINLNKTITSTEFKIFYPDIVAYIDGVDTVNDEILDWKSSVRKEENEIEYRQQLLLYSWLYYKKFGRIPKKSTVYYLRYTGSKAELSFSFTQEDIKQVEDWFYNILEKMKYYIANSDKLPEFNRAYYWCPYKSSWDSENEGKIKFTIHIYGNYLHLEGFITELLEKGIKKKFSYELKQAFWIKCNKPLAKTHIDFWNSTHKTLPLGFKDELLITLQHYADYKKVGLELDIKDHRIFDDAKIVMPDKFINGKVLRDYQVDAVGIYLRRKVGILELATGAGKCFGKGTKILMFDFSIKNVEDICIGDIIMGDDGTPRNVLQLSRGKEQMYRVKQKLMNDYVINESHILSLRKSRNSYKKLPEKIDISLKEYLKWTDYKKLAFGGYKGFVELPEKNVLIEPYFLGLWLGDGAAKDLQIINTDKEVINYLENYAKKLNMSLSVYNDKRSKNILNSYAISNSYTGGKENKLLTFMRQYNLIGNKHIPFEYIYNSRKIRLELLAGLVDSDGYVEKHNRSFSIYQKRKDLAQQIYFLCNSLGFYSKLVKTNKYYKILNRHEIYYGVYVKGNLAEIPTKIKRKKLVNAFYPIRYNSRKIKIVKENIDEYYGFVIDGNKRFLLEDFTVVHNTEIAIEIARQLGVKTLFIVDKIEMLRQTKERIESSLGIEVGSIGAGTDNIKDITVATIQTLNKRINEYREYLSKVRFVIFDETHKVAANSYIKISRYLVGSEYRLGLSGTAFRDDGNDMQINAVTGYIIHKIDSKTLIEKGWLVKPQITFISNYMPNELIKEMELRCKTGLINETQDYMTYYDVFITNNTYRNDKIIERVNNNKNKKILILTKLIDHGKLLNQLIPGSNHLYGATNKEEREKMFNDFINSDSNILISTISIFSEGIDIPSMNIVINASANKGDVKTIQVLGRVLRILEGKIDAQYIDFMDETRFFKLASIARRRALRKQGHDVDTL